MSPLNYLYHGVKGVFLSPYIVLITWLTTSRGLWQGISVEKPVPIPIEPLTSIIGMEGT